MTARTYTGRVKFQIIMDGHEYSFDTDTPMQTRRLTDEEKQAVRVKIIESRRDRAVSIAETLDRTVILHGSTLSEDLLREADIPAAETLVAVTNDAQANILTSVLAKHLGCRRTHVRDCAATP